MSDKPSLTPGKTLDASDHNHPSRSMAWDRSNALSKRSWAAAGSAPGLYDHTEAAWVGLCGAAASVVPGGVCGSSGVQLAGKPVPALAAACPKAAGFGVTRKARGSVDHSPRRA